VRRRSNAKQARKETDAIGLTWQLGVVLIGTYLQYQIISNGPLLGGPRELILKRFSLLGRERWGN